VFPVAGLCGESQLTDAIAALLETQPLLAFAFDGQRSDCGSRQGFVQATLDYTLSDAGLSENLQAQIRKLGRD
jgi:UTP--glucose-1-phosphate uridylyltransferase